MPEPDEIFDEGRRLRDITQQTRVRVAESKLAVVLTLCTVAETCLSIGDTAQAGILIEQAEQMATSAGFSIATVYDIPVAALHSQLTKLQGRIRKLKMRLTSYPAH